MNISVQAIGHYRGEEHIGDDGLAYGRGKHI